MDTASHAAPAPSTTGRAARRPAAVLALVLATATGAAVLTPAGTGPASSSPVTRAAAGVVVTSATGSVGAAAEAVRAAGGSVLARLPLAGGVHAQLPAGAVLAPSLTVVDNGRLRLEGGHRDSGREPTAVREALGLGRPAGEGRGVRIAVVDTGVADSADFGDRLTHVDVTGSWAPGRSRDEYGHGTFVAGVAAGDGTSSGGRFAGVAPGAQVLDVRVADASGSTDLATVLLGLEAVAAADVDVVNLSLSSDSPLPYQVDPLTVALQHLWAQGTVVVVPSGNDGGKRGSVTSPGVDPTLLTVGALDERLTADRRDDRVPRFSGRGPAPQSVAKPDLAAPGQSLVSLRAPGSVVDVDHPGAKVGEDYFRGSGTSFSSAAVAGAAATLLQGRGALSPDEVKTLLRGTAYSARGLRDVRDGGAGGMDLPAALLAPTPSVPPADIDAPPPGDVAVWQSFVGAVLDGDRAAAARAWADLSPEARGWAASRWAEVGPEASRWAAGRWAASRWAGADGTEQEWQMRFWAASRWAASRWAHDDLAASRWASNDWPASRWADETLATSRWAASRWAASRWATSRWAPSSWAASSWH